MQISAKIDRILAENGCLNLLDETQERAEVMLLDQLGLTSWVTRMKEFDQELKALEERKDQVTTERKQLAKQIASVIQGIPESKVNVGWQANDWNLGLSKLAKREIFPGLLNETPVGKEVAELQKSIESIERSIMLVTSPVDLRMFLSHFFDENDIDYEREIV